MEDVLATDEIRGRQGRKAKKEFHFVPGKSLELGSTTDRSQKGH